MEKLLINAIYLATEGEGVRIGTPQIFVRTQGCAIGCVNCDSKETWEFDESMSMSVASIFEEVQALSGKYPHRIKTVSITGGDPLHAKHIPGVKELVKLLKKDGYYINIEASGSRVIDELFDAVDFLSFDFKTPSTGVRTKSDYLVKLQTQYKNKFQVKSVITDKHDFEYVYNELVALKEATDYAHIDWVLTPCYEPNEEFPKERFEMILNMNHEFGAPFRVIGQQHKWIFGPDIKRV